MALINSRLALDLHTDMQNIKTYTDQGNVALVRELVLAAEAKLHQMLDALDEVRTDAGMSGCGKVVAGIAA